MSMVVSFPPFAFDKKIPTISGYKSECYSVSHIGVNLCRHVSAHLVESHNDIKIRAKSMG